jgi:hypothetical protein
MLRNRNLDIVIAAIVAILGGLAAAKHMSGQVTIPLGIGLFFAPGYLWSEAILSHELPGFERAMTSAGMALIFPIIGGFLFYALHIPLFRSSWIGLLVVLTLAGVVAVAVQRLRPAPDEQQQSQWGGPQPRGGQQPRAGQQRRGGQQPPPRQGGAVVLHSFIFGLAAIIVLGAVGYSVKSAENQHYAPYTMFSMTPAVDNALANNIAELGNNKAAQALAAAEQNKLVGEAKTARIKVENYQGVAEQYMVKLWRQGKLSQTWTVTLSQGQSWQVTVSYENAANNYAMLADLFLEPNTATPFHYVNNGGCVSNIKLYPVAIRSEDPCFKK